MTIDDGYSRRIRALPQGAHEAVAVTTVQEFLDLTVPARAFLPKAKNDPLTQRVVDETAELHDLIQRDLTGQKLKNARDLEEGLPRYVLEEWLPEADNEP